MPIGYGAMRMLRLRSALAAFVRRWGVQLAIVLLLFSAGSNAPLTIAAALAGSLVWPLRHAAAHGALVVPMTIAYALVGSLPVVSSRPLWWPRGWDMAERALPLPSDAIRRSDLLVALIVMTPWQGLLLLGDVGAWIDGDGARDGLVRWITGGAWLMSAIGSLALSTLWMGFLRRRAKPASAPRRVHRVRTLAIAPRIRSLGIRRALITLPMLRGRAKRSACASIAGLVAALACATMPLWSPVAPGWPLAAMALVVLVATSLSRVATVRELQPLWDAHRALPIVRSTCERTRILVVLTPMMVGLLVGMASLASGPSIAHPRASIAHPRASIAYCASLAIGCVVEAMLSRSLTTQDHAARWLLTLVIAIACASEV